MWIYGMIISIDNVIIYQNIGTWDSTYGLLFLLGSSDQPVSQVYLSNFAIEENTGESSHKIIYYLIQNKNLLISNSNWGHF